MLSSYAMAAPRAWSRHAESGDRNDGNAVAWPRYDEETDENIVLDLAISTQAGLKKELCGAWDGFAAEAL
ncbi:hypothetical protein [Sorangium sp. So ce693]|uniref:hypothetical protein n=1 Tax=Sorangium sp. So ce693 TaxID=3133318 RepID=UPI003F6095C8